MQGSTIVPDERDGTPLAACTRCQASLAPEARFCSLCGLRIGASAAPGEGGWDGAVSAAPAPERRQLTVLFCDLVGSTALSEQLDPEDLTTVLATFHRTVSAAMREYGGFVARYLGDGELVYFGYPEAHEDDAERAVCAALRVIESLHAVKLPAGEPAQARIGIATGVVIVGDVVGAGSLRGLDVAGAAPNLAARLQGLAPPGGILVADSTHRLVGGLFEWRELGPAAVKGFAEPVPVWQVLSAGAGSSRFEAQRGRLRTPLLGRDAELSRLVGLWEATRAGQGQLVLIRAEAGLGKSRLVAALMERVDGDPHTRLRYFGASHRQHSALYPCIQQLEHAAAFARGDAPAEKLAKLEALLGDIPMQDLQLIAELLLLPTGDRFPPLQFAPQRRRERVLQALIGILERLAATQPLLLIFEDAHWSDESSRVLLRLLAARIRTLRMLVVVTARPDFEPDWQAAPHLSEMVLAPLDAADSARLVQCIAGDNALHRRVVTEIVARTDGVPLFLEELTQAVVEAPGADGADAAAPARVPHSLQAAMQSRLDRLGTAREIAEVAAVIGRDFSAELVMAVSRRPDAEVADALERLSGAGLIQPRGGNAPGDTAYGFRHSLLRDASYGSLLRERRRELHARVVQCVEADFPDWAAAHPELLGYHCGEAGMAKKAAGYRLSAGVQALRRSAMSDALVHLQRGLDLLRELPADEWRTRCELDLTLALGKAQIATQGYATQATGATFTRARALCSALGDPPQVLAVLHGLWTHALMRGELESARAQALALLEAGTQRADPLALLMGHRFSGVTHHPLGEFKRAHALLERGLALYDPQRTATYFAITVDDPKVVMQVYLSWSLMCMGRLRESKWHSAQALEEARRMAHAYTLAHALVGASFVTLTVESPEAGLVRLDELEPLLAEQGIAYYGAVGTLFRGWCLAQLGDAAAERVLAAGMAAYRATGTALYLSGFLRMSAESHLHIGRNALAAVQLREAFAAMEATSQRWDEAELHRVQGRLLLAEGDASGADAAFQRAAAIARAQGASLWALRAATDLARLRAEKGARDQGQKVLEPAFDALDAPVEAPDVRVARTLLAQLR